MVFKVILSKREYQDDSGIDINFTNPLAAPTYEWYQFHKRLHLLRWWIKHKFGRTDEAALQKRIIQIGNSLGISTKWLNKTIEHAITEFSVNGLGVDYYGYHNINHELEATYFTLLAAYGQKNLDTSCQLDLMDIKYLFTSALYHDFDPLKRFEKPNEDAVESYIRNDKKIKEAIDEAGLNLDIVIAIIHRTAYPFQGEIADHARQRMHQLFTNAGISLTDLDKRKHYEDLGWFLSVSERVAGYALDDFEHALRLARRNAHGLGWHPSRINKESVKFFSLLNKEKPMLNRVLDGISDQCRENYRKNILKFKESFLKEIEIKNAVRKKEINLVFKSEDNKNIDSTTLKEILNLYNELDNPLEINNEKKFTKSIRNPKTILVTLRLNEDNGRVIGFAKGGPLEYYRLRRGTIEKNFGKKNTVFLERINIKTGYWGESGGHNLRMKFLLDSKNYGYKFVTGYVHRDVLFRRLNNGEPIRIIQRYDPDKLDYYRLYLNKLII
ncbi:MAG TPA: hypothetical protein VFM31_05325 [Nitrososphaeraceae archaeon]|nr:hypothetical protein [Nitrososphaeraceae archaeon]